jgi:hypothetical protein
MVGSQRLHVRSADERMEYKILIGCGYDPSYHRLVSVFVLSVGVCGKWMEGIAGGAVKWRSCCIALRGWYTLV